MIQFFLLSLFHDIIFVMFRYTFVYKANCYEKLHFIFSLTAYPQNQVGTKLQ